MRPKQETLGSLGRAPARTSKAPPLPPPEPPAPERGAIRRWIHSALFDNIGLKFLSIVLAVTVFLLVNTDKDREITARVAVSYTLPDDKDKVLVSERIEEVRVTVKGSARRLRKLDEVEPINLDLRRATNGEIAITTDMIHVPSGLTITSISPRFVRVMFDRGVDKIVEITPKVSGTPQHGYIISEVKPAPATIKVHGPETALSTLSAVNTREVSLAGRAESFVAETDVLPPDHIEVEGSPHVLLHVAVDEELVTRKLPGLVVAVRGVNASDTIDPAKWTVTPPQVEITLTGALLGVEKAKTTIAPVVKVAPNDGKPREAEIVIDGLTPGIGVKVSPERVKLTPVKPAPAPAPPPP